MVQRRVARLLDEKRPVLGGRPVPTNGGGGAAQGEGVETWGGLAISLRSQMDLEGFCPALVGKKEVNSRSF